MLLSPLPMTYVRRTLAAETLTQIADTLTQPANALTPAYELPKVAPFTRQRISSEAVVAPQLYGPDMVGSVMPISPIKAMVVSENDDPSTLDPLPNDGGGEDASLVCESVPLRLDFICPLGNDDEAFCVPLLWPLLAGNLRGHYSCGLGDFCGFSSWFWILVSRLHWMALAWLGGRFLLPPLLLLLGAFASFLSFMYLNRFLD
ncbi:hypothetical protein MA16_Dca014694 [Dendrobium catenatum]|uniref:Uncharacterized protein n=1 Tax=Dendrobium catenatum TaxID=906689 RepID=A0A2I0W8V4_9ASPA|nr:hypothetical protein MA16_Dca014694 [Dendrobium catenatum]